MMMMMMILSMIMMMSVEVIGMSTQSSNSDPTPILMNSDDNVRGDPTPIFKYVAKDDTEQSHYDFGLQVGRTFSEKINARLDQDSDLEDSYNFVRNTSEGQQIYREFLDVHRKIFPLYVKELEGIASGANVDFQRIFVKNLILEIDTLRSGTSSTDHCSDYQMCTKEFCGVGHNEDDSEVSLNHTAIVKASFPSVNFTGFTYLGDLTSGAFGFNSNHIAFTLNWVGPNNVVRGGLGRGFVSRSLMEATNLDDAISRVTAANQCAGHNVQLMDVQNRRVVNIETAPWSSSTESKRSRLHTFMQINTELLKIEEHFGPSSTHRIARVRNMSIPHDAASILNILGDQNDTQYPIFHDVLSHKRGKPPIGRWQQRCLIWT